MASRIKGITVEIGGDTTGLDKALKSVNTTIKNTQSSLKDVNKLLKLDPSNTELLSQKQKLLKDAIGATKEKLDSLKAAQEQAATTSTSLAKIDEVGQKMESVGNSIAGAGKSMMPLTLAIGGVGTAAVKTAADFDAGMSQVAAISGATGDDLEALRDKAREMGSKTKFSASEAASAMEYMAMAGWKTGDMLGGIEGIMNLAAASGEDLATTSDIVTDALTAFGHSAEDSGHFADILAAASSNANTNVSMMGETFKYCAPIAGALGFSAEDTAEAIGLMANAGIKSTQAGTALRTIMNNLTGEVKISGKSIGDVTIATTNADGSMRGLSDILADCRTAFSGLSESEKAQAAETLVGKNAMSGFLALMNAAPEDIDKLSKAIDNCDGTAESMAATMQDNLAGQLTILKSQLEELAISFGEILMPAIRSIVSHIQGFIDKLNGMDESQKKAIITIGLVVAAIGPLLVIIGTVISKVGVAMQGFVKLAGAFNKIKAAASAGTGIFGKLGAAIGGVSAPVLAVVAVIAVLVAAFVHLWNTNEGFREAILGTWEKIKTTVSNFVEGIRERLAALGISFSDIAETIKAIWNGLCAVLAPIFEGAFNAIANVLQTVFGVITGILDVFIGLFTGNWEQVWTGVKEIFSSIWEGIKGAFQNAIDTIRGIADAVLGWFGTSWNDVWSSVKAFFEGIWNGIASFFSGIWNGIQNTVTTVLNAIKSVITTVWNAIKTTIITVLNGIKTTVTSVWNAIKSTVTSVLDGIKSTVSSVWNGIKSTISSVVEGIKSTVSSAFNAVKSTATSVWNSIKSAIETPINAARDAVKGAIDKIKSFFNFSWSLPKLKLPHLSITGSFSIAPPSVPHFSISWYKKGGIMTSPTLFGINGSSLMAGGEAGPEAILPLKGFYDQLSTLLDQKLNTSGMEKYLAIIADNSSKGIYLEDGTLVGHLLPAIDSGLGKAQKLNRRLSY